MYDSQAGLGPKSDYMSLGGVGNFMRSSCDGAPLTAATACVSPQERAGGRVSRGRRHRSTQCNKDALVGQGRAEIQRRAPSRLPLSDAVPLNKVLVQL
jgi:hypothetical protein